MSARNQLTENKNIDKDHSTDELETFLQLSSLLSGFNVKVIGEDSGFVKELFLRAQESTGHYFRDLLLDYTTAAAGQAVADMTPKKKQRVGEALLGSSDRNVTLTALAVNTMWYLGSWYQPFDYNGKKKDLTKGVVISQGAYINGLAWQVMQGHAMGSSSSTYGYWSKNPPVLSNFTGNPSDAGESQ